VFHFCRYPVNHDPLAKKAPASLPSHVQPPRHHRAPHARLHHPGGKYIAVRIAVACYTRDALTRLLELSGVDVECCERSAPGLSQPLAGIT